MTALSSQARKEANFFQNQFSGGAPLAGTENAERTQRRQKGNFTTEFTESTEENFLPRIEEDLLGLREREIFYRRAQRTQRAP